MNNKTISLSKSCFDKKNITYLKLNEVMDLIKTDKSIELNTKLVREAPNKSERSKLKKNLPVVIFQGNFNVMSKKGFQKHSGMAVIDIDVYNGIDKSLEIKERVIQNDHVVFCFLSPSGGLKVGCRIPEVKSDEEYKEYYLALIDLYKEFSIETDSATKDICRLCFLSHDPNVYINYDAVKFEEKKTIKKIVKKEKVEDFKTGTPEIREALTFVSPDERETWIQVCCALKSEKKEYFALFNEWSSQSEKYSGESDCLKTWESFDEQEEGIKIGTLFFLAKKNGYKPKYNFKLDVVDMSVENQVKEILDKSPIYYDDLKKWWAFDSCKNVWRNVDEVDIISFIKRSFGLIGLSEGKKRTEILNALKDEGRYRKPKETKETEIQIGRFIYDMASDSMFESSPEYKCRFYIDRDIDEIKDSDSCSFIDGLFSDWMNEDKEILYDVTAFMMSPKYFIDVCVWLVGAGENGKGLFQQVILKMIGYENSTSQDIELLSDPKDRFTKLFLKDKLVCCLGDGNHGELTNTKGLKTLSGCQDPIKGEMKGSSKDLTFFNTAKLLGSYNTLPDTTDKTNGFYRRQYIVEFKNSFTGMRNPMPDVPEIEYDILCYKSLKRLREMYLRKTKGLIKWGNIQDRRNKYEKLSNPIGIFMEEKMVEDFTSCFAPHSFEKRYRKWAIKNGYNQFSKKELDARVENILGKKQKKWVYTISEGECFLKEEQIPEGKKIEESKQWRVFLGFQFTDLVKKDKKCDKCDKSDGFFS